MTARRQVWLAIALIGLAGLAAYAGSLRGPFVFDDDASLVHNPTIHHLWTWPGALVPPALGATVQGRPVLNLSFAINYAISGSRVWSYHAANGLIHLLAGLTLFGIIRRTLGDARGGVIGCAVALLWTVHPLQTESVTYTVQRAESLMGLFYLLTLYCFIRNASPSSQTSSDGLVAEASRAFGLGSRSGPETPGAFRYAIHRMRWDWISVICCLLGMGTKEVMVSAPVIILCYDRTFLAGSFRAAWRRRRGYYLALASTWLLLLGEAYFAGSRGGTVGAGSGVSFAGYLLTQAGAIGHYLSLSLWPHPLILDYGANWVSLSQVFLPGLLILALVAATCWALIRRPAFGLIGLWFFAILAPTSLIPGNRQTIAEHRMYLPLAAVLLLLCLAVERLSLNRRLLIGLVAVCAISATVLTFQRNQTYASAFSLYGDTVAHRPENPYAHLNYGFALGQAGQTDQAIQEFQKSLAIRPDFPDAHYNLGLILTRLGHTTSGIAEYRRAVQIRPDYPEAQYNLGIALAAAGQNREAIECFAAVVRLQPAFADGHIGLGNALIAAGQPEAGVRQLEESLKLTADSAEGRHQLGLILARAGLMAQARPEFERAAALDPSRADLQLDLGNVLLGLRLTTEAEARYRAALRLRPGFPEAQHNLAYIQSLLPAR